MEKRKIYTGDETPDKIRRSPEIRRRVREIIGDMLSKGETDRDVIIDVPNFRVNTFTISIYGATKSVVDASICPNYKSLLQ